MNMTESQPQAPVEKASEAMQASASLLRARSGLGGSHTVVTYPPLNSLEPLDGPEPFAIDGHAPVHLYAHVAFCEYICSFCHYQRSLTQLHRSAPAIEPYIEALGREVTMRAASLGPAVVESVYLGGGTPTSLTIESLRRLIGHLSVIADLKRSYFAFETSPKTVCAADGADKLGMLIEAGAKRVSIGVQTFDDELLRQQRGHGRDELERALEQVFALGLTVNIDLIQDLPLQQDSHIEADLEAIARYMPDQVTWYTLRAQKGSMIGKLEGARTAREAALFSTIADGGTSVARRLRINAAMQAMGYHLRPGGRFQKQATGNDVFKSVRNGLSANLLGFGVSSYSHGWGYFFRNLALPQVSRSIADYIARMATGLSPVGTVLEIDPLERAASAVIQAARSFIPYTLLDRDDESGEGWRNASLRCLELGLFSSVLGGLQLTQLGHALEEEISSLFYSAPVRRKLVARGEYWADDSWFNVPNARTNCAFFGPTNKGLAA